MGNRYKVIDVSSLTVGSNLDKFMEFLEAERTKGWKPLFPVASWVVGEAMREVFPTKILFEYIGIGH